MKFYNARVIMKESGLQSSLYSFFFMYMCVCTCLSVGMWAVGRRESEPLELKSQAVGSCPMPWCECWESKVGYLQQQQMLLKPPGHLSSASAHGLEVDLQHTFAEWPWIVCLASRHPSIHTDKSWDYVNILKYCL